MTKVNDIKEFTKEISIEFERMGINEQNYPTYLNPEQFGKNLRKRQDDCIWIRSHVGSGSLVINNPEDAKLGTDW